MSDFELREMEEEDRQEVAELIYLSTNQWYLTHGHAAAFGGGPAVADVFCAVYGKMEGSAGLVAVDGWSGQLIGSCFYHVRPTHVSLGIMNAHPSHFGRGVARRLLQFIIDLADREGKPVRLRFVLKDADLYALRFGPAPPPEKLREGLYTFDADSPPLRETTLIVPGGNEDVTYRGNAKLVVDGRQSAVGSGAVVLEAAGSGLTTVELPRTRNLGSSFTLAAFITFRDARWTRLFSNYSGSGKPALDELALSFDPSGKTAPGLVYTAKSVQVHSGPVELKTGRYYHVAVTHADGAVRLYVDGEEVATGEVPSGPVLLASNLGVGEDIGGPANEQLRGCIDEILVLGQALSASKIRALSERRKPCPPQVPAAPSPDRGHD